MLDNEYTPTFADEIEMAGHRVMADLRKYNRTADPYDFDFNGELEAIAERLERMAAEVREAIGHTHSWRDDDICSVCGVDGRA